MNRASRISRLAAREPLLHFLLLGGVVFGLYALFNRHDRSAPGEIVVTAGQIESLAANHAKVWQRPATAEELKGLIDEYVKEEVLSREAIALGLDRNDTVIRRRLQQKMEFLAEDFAAAAEPTEAELADYLANHPEEFEQAARVTFCQVYLNPDRHGAQLEADAAALLAQLREDGASTDLAQVGDRLLLPREFVKEPSDAIAAQFGLAFASKLEEVSPGEWSGPLRSGYGLHLVRVIERTDARVPALEEVRSRVARKLTTTRRQEANQRFLSTLLERYRVTIEWPQTEPSAEPDSPTTAMHR
jgi:hypothetical protein